MSANIDDADDVWLKLNCEGSECVVLNHLLDAGQLERVGHLIVHFDVEKIPELAHQAGATRSRLRHAELPYVEAGEIMFGRSHAAKTANWLAWTEAGAVARPRYSHLARWEFRARQLLYPLKQMARRAIQSRRER